MGRLNRSRDLSIEMHLWPGNRSVVLQRPNVWEGIEMLSTWRKEWIELVRFYPFWIN